MNQSIYFVRASVLFVSALSVAFLLLCFLDRVCKKRISLWFNFVIALIVASFLLFVADAGLS